VSQYGGDGKQAAMGRVDECDLFSTNERQKGRATRKKEERGVLHIRKSWNKNFPPWKQKGRVIKISIRKKTHRDSMDHRRVKQSEGKVEWGSHEREKRKKRLTRSKRRFCYLEK